ncbi:BTAD domain-containing putative transcriptional regulator [Micromonospora sp. NPDC005367]|uniref:AfsR/SARP family transcriptional regulator n=1 Tax=Micromonospora sp. NPDC005367 TaxID=3155590 RepID=UPI0033A8974F
MRWPRRLMSLLFVLVLLVGPPVVLLSLVGPPVRGWPTAEQMWVWVEQPLTEQTLTIALTITAWLVWLVLAYTVTIRVLARLRATVAWLRHLPLPTPLQATATGVAGAAVLGISANAVTASPPQPPHPVPAGSLDAGGDTIVPGRDGMALPDDGIVVSGGWIPRDVAEQVTAVAALVWLRRRRAYRPRPPGQPGRTDEDLAPLPATAAAVQAALAEHPSPAAADPALARLPAAGMVTGGVTLPAAGVGLTGPGALAAGRGLLVTTVLARQRHPTLPLVITRTALTRLLGAAAETLGRRLPGLDVVESPAEAVRILQRRPAGRRGGARDDTERHGNGTASPAHPATSLIVDSAAAARGVQDLTVVNDADAGSMVVLGRWPGGPTWQVDPDGHTHDTQRPEQPGPRLCVLDSVAAADLLIVIAHVDPPPLEPSTAIPSPGHAAPPRQLPRQTARQQFLPRPAATDRRLELRVLGEPALLIDGEPLNVRRGAAVQVLVLLATHPDGADTRQLTAAIWPGLPRRSLSGRLYTTLSELRGSIRTACGLNLIDHADDRYRLNPSHLDVDLWRLYAAAQHAATAVTDTTSARQAVIDTYTGDLAAGRTWPWLDPIRETIRRHIIDAYVALAAAASGPRNALDLLQGAIRIDPYNAELHARTMNALTALGEHDAAAQLHEAYIRRLIEAGLDPVDDARAGDAGLNGAAVTS